VANGAEAVEAFKRHDWELVLLDMQMPVLDGVSAVRAMRDLEVGLGRARTPIAMLSANVLPRHVEDAMQAGADHFIAKPVTPTALAQGLDDLIRAAAANAETAGRG
jgi:CheY-like chemotaxis protein